MSLKSNILDYIKARIAVESREIIQQYGPNSSAALSVLFKNGSIIRKKLVGPGFSYTIHPDMVQPSPVPPDGIPPPQSFDEYWNKDGVLFAIKELQGQYMKITGASIDLLRDIMAEAFYQGRAQ